MGGGSKKTRIPPLASLEPQKKEGNVNQVSNNQPQRNDSTDSTNQVKKQYVPPYPWVTGEVKHLDWKNSEKDFSQMIAESMEPVILTNTVVNKWRAKSLWTPEYISNSVQFLNNVQKHPNKTFSYFHEDHPMSALPGIRDKYRSQTYQRINMTSKDFFEALKTTPPFHYYAATADQLGTAYNDLFPIEPLMVKNSSWTPEKSFLHRWTNVWFGPAGATTHTHYDISYNFYAQLYGIKRFILFPPEEYRNLYLYPFLHPGAQQSQVSFEKPDFEAFPNFKNAKAVEAILYPGDVLYLPPLWFHHVSAITTSMSVSVWTRFPETQTMYETVRTPLPLSKSWSQEKAILGARMYLEMLLDALLGQEDSAVTFVHELLQQRYKNILEKFPYLMTKNDVAYCHDSLMKKAKLEKKDIEAMQNSFVDFVVKHVSLFSSAENEARRNIWLGNMVEQLALTVVGVENAAKFLVDFVQC